MLAPLSGHCGDTGDETLALIIHTATGPGGLLKHPRQACWLHETSPEVTRVQYSWTSSRTDAAAVCCPIWWRRHVPTLQASLGAVPIHQLKILPYSGHGRVAPVPASVHASLTLRRALPCASYTVPSIWPDHRLRPLCDGRFLQFQETSSHRPLSSTLLDTGLFIEGSGLQLSPRAIPGKLTLEQAESFVQLLVDHPHHHHPLFLPAIGHLIDSGPYRGIRCASRFGVLQRTQIMTPSAGRYARLCIPRRRSSPCP
jgi:hypothetical protein